VKITPSVLLATIQLNLLRRPLMTAEIALSLLEIKRHQLPWMVENGKLPWAFNLATRPGRSELRILSACVVERAMGSPIPAIGATKNLELPEVVNLIVSPGRQSLSGLELQRLFQVSPDWVNDSSLARQITQIRENRPPTGPGSSPHFTRESVAKLIERRRVL